MFFTMFGYLFIHPYQNINTESFFHFINYLTYINNNNDVVTNNDKNKCCMGN